MTGGDNHGLDLAFARRAPHGAVLDIVGVGGAKEGPEVGSRESFDREPSILPHRNLDRQRCEERPDSLAVSLTLELGAGVDVRLEACDVGGSDQEGLGPEHLEGVGSQGGKVVNVGRRLRANRLMKGHGDRVERKVPKEGAGRAAHPDAPLNGLGYRKTIVNPGADSPPLDKRQEGAPDPLRKAPGAHDLVKPAKGEPFKGLALVGKEDCLAGGVEPCALAAG